MATQLNITLVTLLLQQKDKKLSAALLRDVDFGFERLASLYQLILDEFCRGGGPNPIAFVAVVLLNHRRRFRMRYHCRQQHARSRL